MGIFFKFRILSIFLIYFLSVIKYCFADSFNEIKNKDLNKVKKNKNIHKTKSNDKNKRKLGEEGEENFHPIRFYFDMYSFNDTFSYSQETRKNFEDAKDRAAEILSNILLVDRGNEGFIFPDDIDYYYEIYNWNKTLLTENITTIFFTDYDFFVLFKFIPDIDDAAISENLAVINTATVCGYIAFKSDLTEEILTTEYLTKLMIHHLIHLLGFCDDSYSFIEKENDEEDNTHYYIQMVEEENLSVESEDNKVPNNVINYARKYFDCDSITRIEIEIDENDNFHWPKRLLLGEIMTSFSYPEEQVISGFTLAFMDGLPTFKVNKNYTGGLMRFGKHKGCEFFNKTCGETLSNDKIVFANEFYLPTVNSHSPEPSCSSGRLSKTIYKIDSSYIPNNKFKCLDSTNYCPIAQFNDVEITPEEDNYLYTGHCFDENTHKDENIYEETNLSNSFCVLSSLVKNNLDYESKVRAVCYQMFCSALSLTIKINNDYIVCPRSGGKIKAIGFNGFILCPDYNLICTGTKLCNNLYCIDKESEEKEYPLNYNYTIQTTQNSEDYNSTNELKDIEGELDVVEEEEKEIKCPYKCIQCQENKYCLKCAPHFQVEGEDHDKCIEIVPNCVRFKDIDTNECRDCKENYFLVKEDNGTFICEEDVGDKKNEQYYAKTEEEEGQSFTYYERCHNGVPFCSICKNLSNTCYECESNIYILVYDGSEAFCGVKNSQLYYLDPTDSKYKSCIKYTPMPNCLECELTPNFNCLECAENHVFVHNNDGTITCTEEGTLAENKYFTTDNKNYYPCDSNEHDIRNCDTCNSKNLCINCNSFFTTANGNSLCILTTDISEQKYYQDSDNYYYLCSSSLDNCLKCDDKDTCINCDSSDYVIATDDKCIAKTLAEVDHYYYYLGTTIDKYERCDTITGCKKCTSAEVCIECQDDYHFVKNDDNDPKTCQAIDIEYYYEKSDGVDTFYRECDKSTYLPNCDKCSSETECTECKTGFYFVEEDNNEITCQNININNYYLTSQGGRNYYKKCDTNMPNCDTCTSSTECTQCKSGTYFVKDNDNQITCQNIDINYYYLVSDEGKSYYIKCDTSMPKCDKCSSEEECTQCKTGSFFVKEDSPENRICQEIDISYYYETTDNNGKQYYKKCDIPMPECDKCSSEIECTQCKTGLYFVKDYSTSEIICQNIDIQYYYEANEDGKNFYKRCDASMPNCEKCSNSNYCTQCENNFAIIGEDHTKCEDLSTEKYYYDTESTPQYRPCSYKLDKCEKCIIDDDQNFKCKECINDYALKHEEDVICSLKETLEGDDTFYSNDTGKNYYSCKLYNDAKKCLKCTSKTTCTECQPGNEFVNDDTLCISQFDEDNHLLYKDPITNFYRFCSDIISDCYQCHEGDTCDKCQENSALVDNNKCLPKEEVQNNNQYFIDESTPDKYISCSSLITGCNTCTSSTVCTSCAPEYELTNDKCVTIIINNNNNDNNDLSTGGIIGIVFGCIGFLLMVAGATFYFLKKLMKRKPQQNVEIVDNEKQNVKGETDVKNENFDTEKPNEIVEGEQLPEVVVHSNKRSIHN